jgi:diguanylate cyclase (GGDEF)-like protein
MTERKGPAAHGDILIVDDTPANLRLLSQVLQGVGYRVRAVTSGARALIAAALSTPDLVLLDVRLPDLNGFEVCARLKAEPKTHDVPVIFISALDETEAKVGAFAAGGVDYVTKPLNPDEVLARVHTHLALRELHLQLKVANEALAERLHELQAANADLAAANARLETEIAARRVAEKANARLVAELSQMARTDWLTGLHNRRYFFEVAGRELERVRRAESALAVLMLDLDRFKEINDTFGHQAGDKILLAVADTLRAQLRTADVPARFGGEELVVLLPDTSLAQAALVADRLRSAISEIALPNPKGTIAVTVSAGVAALEAVELQQNLELLLNRADEALYAAKRAGRDQVATWPTMAALTAPR